MKKSTQTLLGMGALVIAFVSALYSLGWILFSTGAGVTDDRLIKKITVEVVKELQKSEFLQKEIDDGIIRFVNQKRQAQSPNARAKNVRPVSVKRDHILGNPDAEISLIEYSDFECPFCKRFHPVAHKIVKAFDGKVNWVYRHFPLGFHNPAAQIESLASECAAELGGNDSFWKVTDLIYQRTLSNGKGIPKAGLEAIAVESGLEKKAFQTCLESDRHIARIEEDIENGSRSGVTGTPGNFLRNNKTGETIAAHGAVPFEKLKAVLDKLLKK